MGAGASVSINQQSSEDVGTMIAALGEAYIPYKKIIIDNGVNGELIQSLANEAELNEMFQSLGITNFVHKKNMGNLLKKKDLPNSDSNNSLAATVTEVKLTEISSPPQLNSEKPSSIDSNSFKVVDSLTMSPSVIIQSICKIQGIELDPKNIDIGCSKIKSVVELNANQPIVSDGNTVYDCFISYRVFSDADIAEKMYLYFKSQNINAFLDKKCLSDGEDWKTGFLRGLQSSKCFISLLSTKALAPCRNSDKNHQNDNYLLEMETALNIRQASNNSRYIIPVTIGEYINVPDIGLVLKKFTDFDPNQYSSTIKPSYSPKPALEEISPNATLQQKTEINVRNAILLSNWAVKEADKRHENGTKTYSNGDKYVGDIVNGEPNGFGIMTFTSGDIAKGQWIEGPLINGYGKISYSTGYEYTGEFVNGLKQGYGNFFKEGKDTSKYEGQYLNDKRSGFGKLINKYGVYIGEFKNDDFDGHIVSKYNDGDSFEGEYSNGKREGKGVYRYDSGDGDFSKYEGMYKNGKKHGFGKLTSRDGAYHEGQFVNDEEEGTFKYVTSAGKVYSWVYKHGKIQ